MLRQASRSLFVARSRVLLAASTRVPTKGATQASWNPEQGQTAEQRQQATMRRVASGQATAQSVEPMGENWEGRQDVDKQGLWERAKDAAQAAKDALSSNAEKVQEKAQDTTQKMNYKMEAAGETLGDKYQNAKETITEKYEDMKEAVGEKIDNFKDAMQSRTPSNTNQRATQQRQVSSKKGSNQPLGKEHTKIDMSLAAMNEEITIQDLQGDMSHDDEVIAHAAGKARSSNLNDPATAFSTEDLTLQAKGVAPQRFQREITFRGDNVITQDDSDDFEPTYQAQRSQQSFGENMKDTAKAAGETGKQAGSSFMKGLKDTAQAVQNKEAGKKNWQVGDKKSQSWSEVKDSADKQFKKFMQADDKQSEWGQRKGPAFGLEDLTGPTPASTNTFNQKDAGMPQEDIKDLDKQARIGEEEDMNESKKDKNLKSGKKDQKKKDDKNLKSKDEQPEIKSNFGKKKGPAFGVAELSDAGTDAARSTTASSQSKAKGSNDVKGMAQEEAGPTDGTNDVARNIALGAPSKTY